MSTLTARFSAWSGAPWARGLARIVRGLAWLALIGVTGLLVRAETSRPALPERVEAYTDIVYRRAGDRRALLDVYVPTTAAPPGGRPAILALHGGGWHGGSREDYGREVARLARHGYVVVSADYLLSRSGQPSWPENFEDVREAVRWVRRHAPDYGVDPRRIVALGASAGGHLATMLGTYPDGPVPAGGRPAAALRSRQGEVSSRVQAVVDFYGPTDLSTLLGDQTGARAPIQMLLGGTSARWPERYEDASPTRHVSSDDPPMLLIHGQDDRLVPLDQSERLANALGQAGVGHQLIRIKNAGHGFGFRVEGRDLLPEVLAFLDEVWKDDR